MAVILSLLGIVLAAAGVAAVGFGIPINEFTLGTTLVLAGTTALAGGLILIGLAAVVAELGRVTAALQTRVVARPASRAPATAEPPAPSIVAGPAPSIVAGPGPAIAASARPAEADVPPRLRHEAPLRDVRPTEAATTIPPPSPGDVSSTAIERLRSSIPRTERPKLEPPLVAEHEDVPLSPNGAGHHHAQPSAAFRCSRRTVRTEGCRGRSRGWRGCRCLEGVPTGFSVSFEAGAGHDPSGEFRCVLARRAPAPGKVCSRSRVRPRTKVKSNRRSSPCPFKMSALESPDDARARGNGYSEVRCRRRHGLYAVRRRLDRGQASERTGAVRLHRRVARAYRKQFITGGMHSSPGMGQSRPARH